MNSNYKKLTSNGSVSIPVAMRREMGLERGDPLEVSLQKGIITVKPYAPRCIFCGTTEKVVKLMDKGVCPVCAASAVQATEGGMNHDRCQTNDNRAAGRRSRASRQAAEKRQA